MQGARCIFNKRSAANEEGKNGKETERWWLLLSDKAVARLKGWQKRGHFNMKRACACGTGRTLLLERPSFPVCFRASGLAPCGCDVCWADCLSRDHLCRLLCARRQEMDVCQKYDVGLEKIMKKCARSILRVWNKWSQSEHYQILYLKAKTACL